MNKLNINGNTFYQEYDILFQHQCHKIFSDVTNDLINGPNTDELCPKYQTWGDLHQRYEWDFLTNKIIDLTKKAGYKIGEINNTWALVPKPGTNPLLHTHDYITVVFYLKNPHPEYGTKIKFDNYELVVCCPENSLLVFDKGVQHAPIYPPDELQLVYPRYTVVYEFLEP